MNIIETPYDPWAGTAPAAGSASPPRAGAAAGGADADGEGEPFRLFGGDGLSFADVLDIVNPLQHVPVIGHLYRNVTGDSIDPGSRLLGGTLFFGPLGTVGAGVNVLVQHETGKDLGGHVAAMFADDDAPVEVAAGDASPGATPLAAAGTDGIGDDEDPVSAWARDELAWAAAQAPISQRPVSQRPVSRRPISPQPVSRQPGQPAAAGDGPSPIPDADRWLRDGPAAVPAAAGAVPAAPGGWFSETVLSSAADKYRAAQRLAAAS